MLLMAKIGYPRVKEKRSFFEGKKYRFMTVINLNKFF